MKPRFLLLIAAIFSIGLTVFIFLGQPVDRSDHGETVFTVSPGESVTAIAQGLEKAGLIRNRYIFLWEVKRLGLEGKVQAGDFHLQKSQTPGEIAQGLTTGTSDTWVQIIEGLRAEEIAQILKEKMPTYDASWLGVLKKNEGHLFPDTYLIPHDADINTILAILTGNFDKKVQGAEAGATSKLSLDDALILASIVEREARFDEDRPIVAGIYVNRLRLDMALQADATVQYALGYDATEQTWWRKNLTASDLAIRSPYNTYTRTGLPPGPIANPGLSAISAAFHPTPSDYLYYVSDKQGHMHYAKTLEEHDANIAKYL